MGFFLAVDLRLGDIRKALCNLIIIFLVLKQKYYAVTYSIRAKKKASQKSEVVMLKKYIQNMYVLGTQTT